MNKKIRPKRSTPNSISSTKKFASKKSTKIWMTGQFQKSLRTNYTFLRNQTKTIAIKPLIDMSIDVAVLMCLRDIRHNKFEDSLIGTVETSLGQGPVYFNCYPNKTNSIQGHEYCASRVLLKPQKGETTLFITDMTKANVSLPRTIKWDEVTLPEKWIMEKATPSIPRLAPYIEDIKQNNSTKIEITFNRRNSFLSRIEASDYGFARRSFSVQTPSIPIRLFRSVSHNQSNINFEGLDTTSNIPRTTYQQELEDDQKSIQSPTYSSINEPYEGEKRQQIQDKFYKFVEKDKINIPFFDWFHAYTIREDIEYSWQINIIGDPSTNVITTWQIKDGELIQFELPPTTQYQLPKVKDNNDKLVMATPLKTKDVIGESIGKEKIFTKFIDKEATPSHVQIEKPLFKSFKVSEKAKQKFKEMRKQNFAKEEVGDSNSELLTKINSLFKTILKTPQTSENSHKIRTRQTSKLINIIDKDNDKTSDQAYEHASMSGKEINPINTKNWKTPSKPYYQRPTAPDLLLEERGESNFRSFSTNNIYEWNIDAQAEYNILNTLQHMSMVAMTYQTTHDCSKETIINILVEGFSGQLKRW
ncbi:hypothetical protein CR513_28786, partial [Mucuna pruriens]